MVDALGLPLCFEITEGQRHDIQSAKGLFSQAGSLCLLADKAYDSDDVRNALAAQGALHQKPKAKPGHVSVDVKQAKRVWIAQLATM